MAAVAALGFFFVRNADLRDRTLVQVYSGGVTKPRRKVDAKARDVMTPPSSEMPSNQTARSPLHSVYSTPPHPQRERNTYSPVHSPPFYRHHRRSVFENPAYENHRRPGVLPLADFDFGSQRRCLVATASFHLFGVLGLSPCSRTAAEAHFSVPTHLALLEHLCIIFVRVLDPEKTNAQKRRNLWSRRESQDVRIAGVQDHLHFVALYNVSCVKTSRFVRSFLDPGNVYLQQALI